MNSETAHHDDADEDIRAAEALLRASLINRTVTRVMLDYALTLAFSEPTFDAELKIETAFRIETPDGMVVTLKPEGIVDHSRPIVELFGTTVSDVAVRTGGELSIVLSGRRITVPSDGDYEAWGYVDNRDGRVVCMPSGSLAIWSPRPAEG